VTLHGTIARVESGVQRMPNGVRLFLVYAALVLVGVGLSLRYVVDLAISAPVSLPGVAVMALLAYTIFTITLVLQRKEAGRSFAIGLASLTVPAVPFLAIGQLWPAAIFVLVIGVLLFAGLTRPNVRAYLSEP
jgi:hypothetical protein